MGWIQIVLLVIRYGPIVYKVAKQIYDYIKRIRNAKNVNTFTESRNFEAEAVYEVSNYVANRDLGALVNLRNRLRKRAKELGV